MVRQDGQFAWGRRCGLRGISALAFAAAIAASLGGQSAQGQCQYEVAAIITPDDEDACWPFPPSNTFARGMNEKGEVVGYYKPCAIGNERAFFWSEETGFVTLPTPTGVSQAFASDINDHGLIVGGHSFTGVGGKAWVFDPKTQEFTYLEPLHKGAVATNLTVANAINNNGVVAGARVISKPGEPIPTSNAVIWDTNTGEVTDLGVMDGPNSRASSINEAGDLCGSVGSILQNHNAWTMIDGRLQMLGPIPGGATSGGFDINDDRIIAGAGLLQRPQDGVTGHASLWEKGSWVSQPTPPTATSAGAHHLNDLGQAGGSAGYLGPPGWITWAVLWQHGTSLNLNDVVIDAPDTLTLDAVRGLDNEGRIVARGSINGKVTGVVVAPTDRPLTDLNADCVTNVYDLLILVLDEWKSSESPADFDGNGTVDVFDLLILLGNWG